MCFSASASFAAAAALTGIGVYSVYRQKGTPEWPLAIIPFIFAIQQATEGFLWLSLGQWTNAGAIFFTSLFLFFAFFWWPAYIPWVAAKLETDPKRKKILTRLWLLGLAFGATLYGLFLLRPVSAYIEQNSICYGYYPYSLGFDLYPLLLIIYFGLTLVPGVLSKHRVFRVFGIFSTIFATLAFTVYKISFISTWCFFGAILSLLLLIPNKKTPKGW